MVSEKKMTNGNYNDRLRGPSSQRPVGSADRPVDFAGNLTGVAHDITQLAELQGQLFLVDVKEARQNLKLPLVLAAIGGLVSLCAMPLLLVALAHGLILAGLQPWAAYAIVGLVGLLCGAALLWQSWRSLKDSTLVLERSRAELAKNVEWLKQMLRNRSETAREAGCRTG